MSEIGLFLGNNRLMGVLLGIVSIVLLIWLIPKAQLLGIDNASDIARLELENEFRKTLLQAAGGLLVIFGAYRAWQEFQLDRKKYRTEREVQSGELLQGAISLLGSEDTLLRLSALQRLEIVAEDSDRYRDRVIDVLVEFLRQRRSLERCPSTEVPRNSGSSDHSNRRVVVVALAPFIEAFPKDCQIALDIVGRQRAQSRTYRQRLNLTGLNLEKANFCDGCFRDADLSKSSLVSADFENADLRGASLTALVESAAGVALGSTDASWAEFSGANLQHADLRCARFNYARFSHTSFEGAELSGARMYHARDLTPDQLKEGRNFEFSVDTIEKDEPEQD